MDGLPVIRFEAGAHLFRERGMCVMEAVAFLAGEPHSDEPECACPVITQLAQFVNDCATDDERQELLAGLPWRIIGTRDPDAAKERMKMLREWAGTKNRRWPATKCEAWNLCHDKFFCAGEMHVSVREGAALLNKMISLTEPKEIVPQRDCVECA